MQRRRAEIELLGRAHDRANQNKNEMTCPSPLSDLRQSSGRSYQDRRRSLSSPSLLQ